MHNEAVELVTKARSGDERAFTKLYETYYDPIFRYILARCGDVDIAEDITQTTFIKFFKNLNRWRDQGHGVRAYLYRIARNALIDYHRAQKYTKHDKSEEILERIRDGDIGLQEAFAIKQRDQALIATLDKLKPIYKEVVMLRFIEGLDSKSVGQIIGKSDVAVRKITSRAIGELRLHLKEREL